MFVKLLLGDCLEIIPALEEGPVDAILTDLPYGAAVVAFKKRGRNFIGIEKHENYLTIMEKRIREAQAQLVMPV